MKNLLRIEEMIGFLPTAVKDAVSRVAKNAGLKTEVMELHRHTHSEKSRVNQIDSKKRQSLKYVSARTQDRDDEIVIPSAIDLTEFKKYCHVLVNHNYSLLPVGSDEMIEADDFGIKALTNHADTGEGTLANVIWHLVEQGHMKASSIGFVPTSYTKPGARDWDKVANTLQREWKEFDKPKAEKSLSRIITGGVLLEHSFVSVPCNSDAEMLQVIKGMSTDMDRKIVKQLGWDAVERMTITPKEKPIELTSEPEPVVRVIKKADGQTVNDDEGGGYMAGESVACECSVCGLKRKCPADTDCTEDECDGTMNAVAEEKGLGAMSYEDLRQALNSMLPKPTDGNMCGGWVCDMYEDYIIYSLGNKYYRQGYAVVLGKPQLVGDPLEVQRTTVYVANKSFMGSCGADGAPIISLKPFKNEHAARQTEPDQYEKFARENDKGGPGIDFVYGIKDGKSELQAIRFDAEKFTVDEAKKWLKEHDFKTTVVAAKPEEKGVGKKAAGITVADALKGILLLTFDFYKAAHVAHWNVTGPDFTEWHDLFGEIYQDAWEAVDPLAENIRKLGEQAPELVAVSQNGDGEQSTDPKALAVELLVLNERLVAAIKAAFDIATEASEQGVANFLADRQDIHGKWGWQLRASMGMKKASRKGDAPGHEFRRNQYSSGGGGEAMQESLRDKGGDNYKQAERASNRAAGFTATAVINGKVASHQRAADAHAEAAAAYRKVAASASDLTQAERHVLNKLEDYHTDNYRKHEDFIKELSKDKKGSDDASVIRVVKSAEDVRVLFTPPEKVDVEKSVTEAVTLAISRKTGKLL